MSGGLHKFDHLPPEEAARQAWNEPGANYYYHHVIKRNVRNQMPVLARALDRMERER